MTNSPYSLVWTSRKPANTPFFARAEDQLGKSAVSEPVHVTLSATPVVTINFPDGTSYHIGQNVTFQAQFGDPE